MKKKAKRKKEKYLSGLKLTEFFESLVGQPSLSGTLKALRECDELTQKQFAKKLGISVSSLSRIENDRVLVTPSQAVKFAKKLGDVGVVFLEYALEDILRHDGITKYRVNLEKRRNIPKKRKR